MKKPIVLFVDKVRMEAQEDYNNEIKDSLNKVVRAFNEVDESVKFDHTDLKNILTLTADQFIKMKFLPKLEGANIQGMKINPAKAFAMLDMKTDGFIGIYNDFQKLVKETIRAKAISSSMPFVFDYGFFQLHDGKVIINSKYFSEWCEKSCKVVTRNETQIEVYNQLNKVCEGLNSLMEIKRSEEADFHSSHYNAEKFRTNAKYIMNEEIEQLIQFKVDRFVPNNEFILRH